MPADDAHDLSAQAAAVQTVADLARVLRELRRRHARRLRIPVLTYRKIAERTGWSVSTVGGYFTGTRLASVDRFDELIRLLGAAPDEQGILATARELAAESRPATDPADASAGPPGATTVAVPRTLPARVFGFAGRHAELARLDAQLASAATSGTAAVSTVVGMPGVGKTALAVHWAYEVAAGFPDGQLYVNLRGFDPGEPLTATDALAVLISGLGVAPAATPADLTGRVELYRELLAGHRMLVLLDNAGAVEQVRPLLPPAPCLALVTSRNELTGLTMDPCVGRIALDVLTEDEALALLRLLVGERIDREDEAARTLALRCGFLPLALRVAAEYVVSRPHTTLADLVAEFGDEEPSDRLAMFSSTVDRLTDIRSVFSLSLRRLPAPCARAFRLFGLLPGNDTEVYGLAALAGARVDVDVDIDVDVDVAEAHRLAGVLTGAHLIQSDGSGRLSMHDLVRAYAVESGERELGNEERHAALTRLFDYYLAVAATAVDVVFHFSRSGWRAGRSPEPASRPSTPDLTDAAAAASWLAAERDNLVRACVHAARNGWPRYAIALALTLRPYFDDGHYGDGLVAYTEALAAARLLGPECDPVELAAIHGCLGAMNWWLGRFGVASRRLRHAYEENLRAGNIVAAIQNVSVLGLVREAQGRYPEALESQRRGLRMARSAGIPYREAIQLINLGYVHLRLEEYDVAAGLYHEALTIFEQSDEAWAAAHAKFNLATAYEGLGRYHEALAYAQDALAVHRSLGQVIRRIRAMDAIGSIYRRLGRFGEALDMLGEALRVCRDANGPRPTMQVLNTLGETRGAAGHHARAIGSHAEALDLAELASDRWQRTRALVGLGDAWDALGRTEAAREYWREALAGQTDPHTPVVGRIRDRLSRNPGRGTGRPVERASSAR
jgi:tetratricopeptide (TPR) repeat protein/transcriptional regulator with XRE-family HTH domain